MRSSGEELHELYRQMDIRIYESESEGRKRTAQKHLQIVHRYARPGRILDVGCASGLFLSYALQEGWNVTGIEPNEKQCEEAQKKLKGKGEVQCSTLEKARLEGGFDAITLWDVLEHVPDPRRFLHSCRCMLQANGHLFLNVPDLDSWEARLLGRRWPLLLPEHLNYFNRKSLRLCSEYATLTPIKFGRRFAWFSLQYVAHRIAQHGIPGSSVIRSTAETSLGCILIPVSLGETLAVLRNSTAGVNHEIH